MAADSERADDGRNPAQAQPPSVPLRVIAREWSRIGITGFGGPPAHIKLLRKLCVEHNAWLSAEEFEDGIAATSLLPGPASTQLAIFCAWRLAGPVGALIGGACFIVPGLIIILALSVLFLAHSPPAWVRGAAAGAGAAVPAVAVSAAMSLVPASWRRAGQAAPARARWLIYLAAGGVAANLAGQFLVAVLLACGLMEWFLSRSAAPAGAGALMMPLAGKAVAAGVAGSLAWVAVKVGALSFGGGFVIIPLMQHDAVHTYHWMTTAQFLSAVALGQVTPGPVVQTVAVVGYAAAGLAGGLIAAVIAFAPSFVFVLAGGRHFDQFRRSAAARAFLAGSGPAAIGAIGGAAVTLGLGLTQFWQVGVLAAAAVWLVLLRRGVVSGILAAAAVGVIVALAGVTT
ncbi:MAG TPA: chromate efflux transporter [Streptosporangiaceae bacterium]|nr:chromate efflux transporter [Streptosporangiaceae bacterium]